jgi:hypothetical protein
MAFNEMFSNRLNVILALVSRNTFLDVVLLQQNASQQQELLVEQVERETDEQSIALAYYGSEMTSLRCGIKSSHVANELNTLEVIINKVHVDMYIFTVV